MCRLGMIALGFIRLGFGGEKRARSRLMPGGLLEGLADQLADLFFEGAVMGDAFFAFASLCGGEGFSRASSLQETGPAVIGAMELGRFGFTGAVGFTAGAAGGGEAAGQQGEGDEEGEIFLGWRAFFCLHRS